MAPVSVNADQAIIMLAEDLEDDILLIRRAFHQGNILNPLQVVRDGEEAIGYLKGEGIYANRAEYPLPDLLLLDLKMPRLDGFQVLRWIREQPGMQNLRVVVLTSSDQMRDMNQAYKLGANSFLVKPLVFENFVETIKLLRDYWLSMDNGPSVSRILQVPRPDRPRWRSFPWALSPNPTHFRVPGPGRG